MGRGIVFFTASCFLILLTGCFHTLQVDLNDPNKSFLSIKRFYDNGNYQQFIDKSNQFRTSFPYHKLTKEIELLVASSYYKMGEYEYANYHYRQFYRIYPSYKENDYVLFQIINSIWKRSAKIPPRDQTLNHKLLYYWKELSLEYPKSKYLKKAKLLADKADELIAYNHKFIADFYYKKLQYLPSLYELMNVIENYKHLDKVYKDSLYMSYDIIKILILKKDDLKDIHIEYNLIDLEKNIKKLISKI